MTEKQKYIGAYLDGYFSDKKQEYGFAYFNDLKKATNKAKKKWKQYKIEICTNDNEIVSLMELLSAERV